MISQKRKRLNLSEKVEIIKTYNQEKCSVRHLAERFGVGKTQIGDILKNKGDYIKAWAENGNTNSKRKFPKTIGLQVDNLTFEWFCRARSSNISVSGPLICEKALQIAEGLGLQDFKASGGWLAKFKTRHNISFRNVCGESDSVNLNATVESWQYRLPELCQAYEEENIFNCDETGLFFRAMPNKTMCLKSENCTGEKNSKERLTILFCVNMVGEFEKPLIIGKASKPRCFKGIDVNNLGIKWCSNRKAWMTREIMTEWLLEFDHKMERQKRNIILFLDNATSHPDIKLNNIKLVFFPPYMTSVCQPLHQGIIYNFKIIYRKQMLRYILSRMDSASVDALSKLINVLDAVLWSNAALKQISTATVKNCFRKAGFVCRNDFDYENSGNDPNELLNLLTAFETTEDYFKIDEALNTDNESTDVNEILHDFHQELAECNVNADDENSSDQIVDDLNFPTLTNTQALQEMGKLRHYFLTKNDVTGLCLTSELQNHLEKSIIKSVKTKEIPDVVIKEEYI